MLFLLLKHHPIFTALMTTNTSSKEPTNSEPQKVSDPNAKQDPPAVDAVIAASPKPVTSEDSPSPTFASRPWPIDQYVNTKEFQNLPSAVRESLVSSADYANGHTYIHQIEPKTFLTKSGLVEYVLKFADDEGFTVSKQEKDNQVEFKCDHDKVYTQTLKRPHPESNAYDPCPFHVTVYEEDGSWTLKVTCAEHNHGPTGPAASAKRRRFTFFQKTLQDDFIVPQLIKHTTAPGTPKELAEGKEVKKVDQLRALVGALRFDNALIEDQVDENGTVTHLFWTTTDCVEMLQQYPEVLFINFTKSPNLPILVHIVGITSFNTTFDVGYAFISEVSTADFRWVLFSLKDIVGKHLQRDYSPSAVISHREPMLINAIDNVFKNTSQICVTQLMREINDRSVTAFPNVEERRTFIKLFQELVDSETPDIYVYNETDFRKKYAKTPILEFVTYHWLIYKTKFVRAWVDQHLHFNNYSMGKAEIAQATLKGFADESEGDLLKLYYRVNNMLRRKKTAHEELVEKQLEKCPVKFYVPFYDDVRFKISTHALEMIKEQHELYLEAMSLNEPLHRCTRMFTTTTGLPCKHTLSRPVTMGDCHTHWWLSKQRPLKDILSETDIIANELTNKFDRTISLAKEHFLNYSSLEAREYMLSSMIKYFAKVGVSNVDTRSGLSRSHLSSTSLSSMGGSRGTSPMIHPVDTSSDGSPAPHVALSEDSDCQVSGTDDGKLRFTAATRRCGKCNQIGHNSRTCGQRMPLNGL